MGVIKPQSTSAPSPKSTGVVAASTTDQQFVTALKALAAKYR